MPSQHGNYDRTNVTSCFHTVLTSHYDISTDVGMTSSASLPSDNYTLDAVTCELPAFSTHAYKMLETDTKKPCQPLRGLWSLYCHCHTLQNCPIFTAEAVKPFVKPSQTKEEIFLFNLLAPEFYI